MDHKRRLVIDCDVGIDDAQAIMMALAQPHIEVVAITCVWGNVDVEQVSRNVLRVLEVCGKLGEIPVYRGAQGPIIQWDDLVRTEFHGKDGLGDVACENRHYDDYVSDGHAVNKLLEIVDQYRGEVSVVCLGPLTNLALAERLRPGFNKSIDKLSIFGGNTEGRGNITESAEFNFFMDAEAADIVLREFKCPMYITSWETVFRSPVDWEWVHAWLETPTKRGKFMNAIMQYLLRYWNSERAKGEVGDQEGFIICDQVAMAIALDTSVITKKHSCSAAVERQGIITRGQMIVSWQGNEEQNRNINVVTEFDMSMVKCMLKKSLSSP